MNIGREKSNSSIASTYLDSHKPAIRDLKGIRFGPHRERSMIKDATKLQELRDEWTFAITTLNSINTTMDYYEKRTGGGKFDDFLNKIHGLVLTFAFSVLQDTLEILRDEGAFKCGGKKPTLGNLMSASKGRKSKMKWLDFLLVDEGREKRNDLVHHQKVLRREDTWKYIEAIEKELIEWKILTGPAERWTYRGV